MCGILGVIKVDRWKEEDVNTFSSALSRLNKRGPDHQAEWANDSAVRLGHARLSIFDTSALSHQPMHTSDGRFHIVYNGECFNFKSIKKELLDQGIEFETSGDTEVILKGFAVWGCNILDKMNGFFGLAIYDSVAQELTLARDRMGIKPLLYSENEFGVIFSSEMKSIMPFPFKKCINKEALNGYLQLNYVPGSQTMIAGINKLPPGTYRTYSLNDGKWSGVSTTFYSFNQTQSSLSYEDAQVELRRLLKDSIALRLEADVPVGTFLSGGIDSSVISTLAAEIRPDLRTFSIGYADEPFYDETHYAEAVATKIGSSHTTFKLTNQDLFEHLFDTLDYLDEPFADSSALAVYILSKRTRQEVTVALSGDGADEMFSGYNKHMAEFKMRNPSWKELSVSGLRPLWKILPHSRNNKITNIFRQLDKFASSSNLSPKDRYWQLASISNSNDLKSILTPEFYVHDFDDTPTYQQVTGPIHASDFNSVLIADLKTVLTGDMLRKVDSMSMANSLEVRTPFLDHRIVDFANSLPVTFKIGHGIKKRILQETFRKDLPELLFNRPKHGFEVPIAKWLKVDLFEIIQEKYFAKGFIEKQGIFDVKGIQNLLSQLSSPSPGDAPAKVWALVCFQHWWLKYMDL